MQTQCYRFLNSHTARNHRLLKYLNTQFRQRRLLTGTTSKIQDVVDDEKVKKHATDGDDVLRKSQRQYSVAIANCRGNKNVKRAMKLLQEIKQQGVIPSVYCYTAALGVLSKAGDVKRACALFEEMKMLKVPPTLNAYTNLMACHSRAGDWQACMDMVKEMNEVGVTPDAKTFATIISALSRARETSQAIQVFNEEVLSGGLDADLVCFNAVIGACAVSPGEYEKANDFFMKMKSHSIQPDAVTYTLLMKSCRNSGRHDLVSEYFEQMQLDNIEPNSKIYANLISSLGSRNQSEDAVKLFEDMKKRKLEDTPIVGSALVHALAQDCKAESALQVISELRQRFSPRELGPCYLSLINSLYILDEIEALDGLYHEAIFYDVLSHWTDTSKRILDLNSFNVATAFAALRYAFREIALDFQEYGTIHGITIHTGEKNIANQGGKSLHDELLRLLKNRFHIEAAVGVASSDLERLQMGLKWTIHLCESNLKEWVESRIQSQP